MAEPEQAPEQPKATVQKQVIGKFLYFLITKIFVEIIPNSTSRRPSFIVYRAHGWRRYSYSIIFSLYLTEMNKFMNMYKFYVKIMNVEKCNHFCRMLFIYKSQNHTIVNI